MVFLNIIFVETPFEELYSLVLSSCIYLVISVKLSVKNCLYAMFWLILSVLKFSFEVVMK